MRFPAATRLVRSYAAMSGLKVAPAMALALICDVTEALAGYAGPQGLVYSTEAVLARARR